IDLEANLGPCEGVLEGRRALWIADQAIGEAEGERVHRSTRGNAERAVARPSRVLHGRQRTRAHDLDGHRGTNFTRSPGSSRVGGLAFGSKSETPVRPRIRQPPGV